METLLPLRKSHQPEHLEQLLEIKFLLVPDHIDRFVDPVLLELTFREREVFRAVQRRPVSAHKHKHPVLVAHWVPEFLIQLIVDLDNFRTVADSRDFSLDKLIDNSKPFVLDIAFGEFNVERNTQFIINAMKIRETPFFCLIPEFHKRRVFRIPSLCDLHKSGIFAFCFFNQLPLRFGIYLPKPPTPLCDTLRCILQSRMIFIQIPQRLEYVAPDIPVIIRRDSVPSRIPIAPHKRRAGDCIPYVPDMKRLVRIRLGVLDHHLPFRPFHPCPVRALLNDSSDKLPHELIRF